MNRLSVAEGASPEASLCLNPPAIGDRANPGRPSRQIQGNVGPPSVMLVLGCTGLLPGVGVGPPHPFSSAASLGETYHFDRDGSKSAAIAPAKDSCDFIAVSRCRGALFGGRQRCIR
jgi:hypothetical protein